MLKLKYNSINRAAGTPIWVTQTVNHDIFYESQIGDDGIIKNIINKLGNDNEIAVQMNNALPTLDSGL